MNKSGSLQDENLRLQRIKAEAREEGHLEGLREAVVTVVKVRFPPLTELAQQMVASLGSPQSLILLLEWVAAAPSEAVARFILSPRVA